MRCFSAAITLWLAAVVTQIHAEVSLPYRLASNEVFRNNRWMGLISILSKFFFDVIGFRGFVMVPA